MLEMLEMLEIPEIAENCLKIRKQLKTGEMIDSKMPENPESAENN